MYPTLLKLVSQIEQKSLQPNINLDRPRFLQPEDRMLYRAFRIIFTLGHLNVKTGLSKEVIACMDFLLRNPGYQKKFIIEYFKSKQSILINKLENYSPSLWVETDFNIVQYKSVPWDLRFNDMFLFLHVRNLVRFVGKKPNLRVCLSETGEKLFETLTHEEIFIDEQNFLELFGKRLIEEKAKDIITEVIPSSYWKENEKSNY